MLETLYQYIHIQTLGWLIVFLPLAGAAINGVISLSTASIQTDRARPWVSFFGSMLPLISFVCALLIFVTLIGIEKAEPSFVTGSLFSWAAAKGLIVDVALKFDQLSSIMALVVTGVGSLIHIYSVGYMANDHGYARYFSLLNLFLFFMLLLVLADNLVIIYVGWEGVGLCSYLLIGFWFDDEAKAKAGTKAFIINRIGDVGFLIGIFLVFGVMAAAGASHDTSYFNVDHMQRYAGWFLPVATFVSMAFFIGTTAKSAQIPLYVWLPDAMAGPTPVSALIHAATMVAAGIYLIARLNFIFILSPITLQTIAIVGSVTALIAAIIGIVQTDIKKILAYSTISQLGLMFLASGIGAFSFSVFHLTTHACFKALLFLCAGSVIKAMHGEQDIRMFGGLKERMPITAWSFVIAAAAISGIFPTSGFVSKDAILWQTFERGHYVLWSMAFVTVGLTAFYIFRAVGMVFFGDVNAKLDDYRKISEPSLTMVVPIMLLTVLTLFGGLANWPEALGGSQRLTSWLDGVMAFEKSHAPGAESRGTEIIFMAITLLWAVHFSIVGWVIYAQKRNLPEKVALRFKRFHKLILNKFYVDEIYDLLFVRPIRWFAKRILWQELDKTYIDGLLVNGSARTVGFWSSLVSAIQTGNIQNYIIYFLIGATILVGIVTL